MDVAKGVSSKVMTLARPIEDACKQRVTEDELDQVVDAVIAANPEIDMDKLTRFLLNMENAYQGHPEERLFERARHRAVSHHLPP
ncbi:hypothetical protein OL229_13680 [Neisseriaceae bacterium JH1-16]|nr:hypothetical protein [Neisseriaceae bacterium JH1-16]